MDPIIGQDVINNNSRKRKLSLPAISRFNTNGTYTDPRVTYNLSGNQYKTSIFGSSKERIIKAVPQTGQVISNALNYSKPVVFTLDVPAGHLAVPNNPNTIIVECQLFYTSVNEDAANFNDESDTGPWLPYRGAVKMESAQNHLITPDTRTFLTDCFEEIGVTVDGVSIVDNYTHDVRSKASYVTRTICNEEVRQQRLGGTTPLEIEPKRIIFNFQKEKTAADRAAGINVQTATDTKPYTNDYIKNLDELSKAQINSNFFLHTHNRRDTVKIYGNFDNTPLLGNDYNASFVTLEDVYSNKKANKFVHNFVPSETKLQFQLNLASQLTIGRRLKRNHIDRETYFSLNPVTYNDSTSELRKYQYRVKIVNVEILYKAIEIPRSMIDELNKPMVSYNFVHDVPKMLTYTIPGELNQTVANFRVPPGSFCAYVTFRYPFQRLYDPGQRKYLSQESCFPEDLKSIECKLNNQSLTFGPLLDDLDSKLHRDNTYAVEYFNYLKQNNLYTGSFESMFPRKMLGADAQTRGDNAIIFLDLNNNKTDTSQNLQIVLNYKAGSTSTNGLNIEVLFFNRELLSIVNSQNTGTERIQHDIHLDTYL